MVVLNVLLTLLLGFLCLRAWVAGRSRSAAEARYRAMEQRALDVMAELARKGVR